MGLEIDWQGKSKGISPVLATVILVTIAVVIAAALAGFSNSIFASYSASPVISVRDIEVLSDGTGGVTLENTGASDDKLISIQVSPNDPISAPFTQSCQGGGNGNGNGNGHGNGNNGNGNCGGNNGNCNGHGRHIGNPHCNGSGNIVTDSLVPANTVVDIPWDKNLGGFDGGQQITVLITMQSGAKLTHEVTVEDVNA